MVGLILFLSGCSSGGKTEEAGWVAFFLKTGEFFHFPVSWGVALNSVLILSNLVVLCCSLMVVKFKSFY